ncbi:MAG TPA: hypothetical protein VLL05_22660, partial [Terriglobales bacterium]|nr:hypothetical protein [Terriglobales bacterium]
MTSKFSTPHPAHCLGSYRFELANLQRPLVLIVFFAFSISALVAQTIRVDVTPDHVANKFVPNQALGAGIDRMGAAAIDKLFTPAALDRVLSAGWQP